jgi:hypothetical protein
MQTFTNVAVNKFYKATEGQGLNEIIIGINNINSEIPGKFELYQNYPNPFNPITKLRFAIGTPLNPPFAKGGTERSSGGLVKLVIFDILGKEVAILINESLPPGTYEIEWNASNYPSGVYFYKLSVGDFNQTRKMILVK